MKIAPAAIFRRQLPCATALVIRRGVEEPVEQFDVVVRPVRIHARDRVGQHRVAEAVDGVGELGGDRRVDVGLVQRERLEGVDRRLDLAGKLLEHEVLVLHLGHEAGGLEETLTVPAGRLPTESANRRGG